MLLVRVHPHHKTLPATGTCKACTVLGATPHPSHPLSVLSTGPAAPTVAIHHCMIMATVHTGKFLPQRCVLPNRAPSCLSLPSPTFPSPTFPFPMLHHQQGLIARVVDWGSGASKAHHKYRTRDPSITSGPRDFTATADDPDRGRLTYDGGAVSPRNGQPGSRMWGGICGVGYVGWDCESLCC